MIVRARIRADEINEGKSFPHGYRVTRKRVRVPQMWPARARGSRVRDFSLARRSSQLRGITLNTKDVGGVEWGESLIAAAVLGD